MSLENALLELAAAIRENTAALAPKEYSATLAPTKEPPAPAAKKAAKEAPTAKASEPAPEPTPEPAAATEFPPYADVQAAVFKLAAISADEARSMLHTKFAVTTARDLTKEQYAAAIAALEAKASELSMA